MSEDKNRIGLQIGTYRIVSSLGQGGMGEVYRAHDSRLGRDVALKLLPASFARDPERLARFEREARVLAALNHPHIAAIYGFEGSSEVPALVLELVEGPTLAERLVTGPIAVAESLTIARQVAEALEAAHERGIIHRDLKPANVKLTSNGAVKVLDFGLAKLTDSAAPNLESPDLSQSPTITVSDMSRGVILGTAPYMSPEQARGLPVDKRTDIWSFGCLVYEMLTRRMAFQGRTVSDAIAAILEREPDWSALPQASPQRVRDLLRRCLTKDAKQRLHDIADARIEIDEILSHPRTSADAGSAAPHTRERLAWVTAVVVLAAAAVGGFLWTRPAPAAIETRLEITTPPTTDPVSLAISPDGRTVAFVATSDGKPHLWIRALDSVSARPLPGTESAYYPFWSPDGRSIAFFADGRLKRIDIDVGVVQNLANATAGRSGVWRDDGVIFFSPQAGPVFRIPAAGGERTTLPTFAAAPGNGRFPQLLPDGRHFLYYALGPPDVRGVYVGEIDGPQSRRLIDADAGAAYAAQGQLLFVRQGTLFAQRFDLARLELGGSPVAVSSGILVGEGWVPALSTSAAGPIVYRAGVAGLNRELVWFDRSGKELEHIAERSGDRYGPSLSPDGRTLAVTRIVDGNTDIWLLDLQRGALRRLTSHAAVDHTPVWSPDGSRILFTSNRTGLYDLYGTLTNGTGHEDRILATTPPQDETDRSPLDWSADARFLLYRTQSPKTRWDLWASLADGTAKPFPVAQTEANDRDGQFSPDGKWVAYESDESGRFEVYVQPFPGPGPKWVVSTSGGAQVRWSRDGKELLYIAMDGRLTAVAVDLDANRQTVEARAPVALFNARLGNTVGVYKQQYMISPDGRRFLMNTLTEEPSVSPITIILNWKPPESAK